MLAWVFFLAVLGVTMAIPMKRQMINVEQLRFPSGIAAAETLRALHATGGKGMRSARALGLGRASPPSSASSGPKGLVARERASSPPSRSARGCGRSTSACSARPGWGAP